MSHTCYVFTLFRCAIGRKSTLQDIVAFSITEYEYMFMTEGTKEEIWLHVLIQSLGLKVEKHVLHCDSQSALSLVKDPVYHEKTKHIDVMLNFIWDILEEEKFSILNIDTKVNQTYMLTKSLPTEKSKLCLDLVDVRRWLVPSGMDDRKGEEVLV